MKITDHLPQAPKGYKWATLITERDETGEPNLIVYLDKNYLSGVVPEDSGYGYNLGYVSAPTLDVDGVRKGAEEVLARYYKSAQEEKRRADVERSFRERYADLLID